MESSVAQMMADLGPDRRDMISFSDDKKSGRVVGPYSCQTGVANNANPARRARSSAAGSSEGGAREAWNNPANFGRNDVAEQMEDRGGGQSHRAALSAKMRYGGQYNAQIEATEQRYGEERALYLRDKTNNYVASTTSRKSKQERFHDLPRGSSTPRILPKASSSSGSRARERGRVASAPQNPNRARSPRSYGTFRFEPGSKQSNKPSASITASKQPAATIRENYDATSHGTRSFTTPSQGVETTVHHPVQSSDAVRASLPGQFNAVAKVSSSTDLARSPANPSDTRSQTFTGSARNGDEALSQDSDLSKHSWHDRLKYMRMAEHYVAHPGPAADAYRKKSADREAYFREAEKSLIKQAFSYAKNVQSQETQAYMKDNKDRQWMIDEAVKAKDFVERDALAEMDAYHADHPHLFPFGKAAKFYFNPKSELSAGLSQQSTSAVGSDRNGGATASTALASTVAKEYSPVATEEWEMRFHDLFSRGPRREGAASAASPRTVVARAGPTDPIAMTNMWEMRNSTETDALSSSNDSVIHAPWSEDAASAASSQTIIARAEPAEAAAASDAQQNSTSSSQPRSGYEHIENVGTAIAQPTDTGITPGFLISQMESFVACLKAMSSSNSALGGSNGAGASVAERKLEGVKMEEDGLWLSDEE
ncbi:hypothetical protein KC343_g12037 [Hortaea werneckii]|uniref:Uncharacterized protein n=1 Tax=Hortaea werneckii TaxID=91943 RepID=A0A3M7D461_HORWE|nr:hypothetical protein KC352_g22397 [Hortaea werneckii]KAI7560182.1 hypothetical protein KC317_g9882 [Hortaea werneckii]KAI7608769.1 hypothetical protein KC346_g9482 [Hortaea werneckii]KAI7610162.1 hypothetical protein KC343_g12037 [Hortaea werneckii]KAI7657559.1 hypothetical protein KC319_g9478 [Hortaea werneckii]